MTEAATRIIPDKLKVLNSYRIDFFFVSLLLILSILYFRDILEDDVLLLLNQVGHGDFKKALTVDEHVFHHLDNPLLVGTLPLLLILYPLQIFLGDQLALKVLPIFILFLAATLVYFANKQFVSRFEGNRRGYWLSASCFVGSLVIMYNPWTIDKIHHAYWQVLSLAALYLLIATIDDYLRSREQKSRKWFLMVAFLASLVVTYVESVIIYFMPMLAIYLTVNLIFHRPKILSKHAAKKISILVIITIACNIFWLVPLIQASTTYGTSVGFSSIDTTQGFVTYGIVHENIDHLSRRGTIQNVLQGTSTWLWGGGPVGGSAPDPSIKINNIDLWEGLAFLPLSFIFLFFFIRRPIGKDITYIVVFFIALVILSVILATGSYYNYIYKRIFLDFPLGEALRDPSKFLGLYFAALSFFASASLYRIVDRKSLRKNMVIFLFVVGLLLSWGWVGLTGNLNGHLTAGLLPYPHDLSDVSEYLHKEYGINSGNTKGNIFWYPAGQQADKLLLQYSPVPDLSTESLHNLRLPPYQLRYIDYLIEKNDTSFIPLLEYLGVQYLVIREDYVDNSISPSAIQEMQSRVQNLKTMLHENMVFESGRFGVYKLNNNSLVSVSHAIYAGTDDLSKVARVANESEYLNNMQLGPFLDDGSLIVLSDLLPPEPSGGAITVVNPSTEHHMPSRYWSTGTINGRWLNTITPYFNDFEINTWQFDYNRDSIFTWGKGSVPSNYTLENAETLTTFNFNSPHEISLWQNNSPEDQALEHESNAMRVVLNSSNSGWKTITSSAIGVSADQVYVAKLGIRYDNAEEVQLRLTEYDKNDVMIENSVITQTIGTGTSDWQDVIFDYTPSSKEVRSIRLSIWHGHLTKQPLPNVLWIDSVGIYEVPDHHLVENSISLPFKVHDGGNNNNYKLFVRYLESPQGGLINAMLEDSRSIPINTLSSHSKFVWRDLGEYPLDEGTHTMTFTNERGFNAINAILLIPKDQFEVIRGQIQDWLNRNSSTALYIFEGESDMNSNNTTIAGEEPSIGDEMILMNSTAWTQFDVKKEGNYKIWIKGSGIFSVVIDDHKEIVNATMNGPTFSGSFQLKEGYDSRLEITPLQELANITRNSSNVSDNVNTIDSIWLVSDSNNRLDELVDDNYDSNVLLNQMQAVTTTTTPISNNLWSSQEYEFELNNTTNTTRPLIISLAEPFNPNLKAAIYTKDGELTKVENLIPLFYSLKSGIYIEDSLATDAKVVIYDASAPLQWLAVSSFISLGSYILLILSANAKLTSGFKGFVCALGRLMKQSISQKKKDNNKDRDYNS